MLGGAFPESESIYQNVRWSVFLLSQIKICSKSLKLQTVICSTGVVSLDSLRIKHGEECRHRRNALGRGCLSSRKGECQRKQGDLENTILAWCSEGGRKRTGCEKLSLQQNSKLRGRPVGSP